MEETILLGYGNHEFSLKAQRRLYFFLGGLFVLMGISRFFGESELSFFSIAISVLMMFAGVYHLSRAFAVSSAKSKYAPKVRLTEEFIEFRLDVFQANISINWADIRAITLMSYGLAFQLTESQRILKYRTSGKISIEIKEAIRDFAETKGIVVDGG